MRQFLFACVGLLALVGAETARAADVPPAVIYPANYPAATVAPYPVATGPFLFTGFYAGATIGGVLGGTKFLETPTSGFGDLAPGVAAVGTSSAGPRGVIGGLEAGYNWQLGHFVLGIETDFSGWDLSANGGQSGAGNPHIPVLLSLTAPISSSAQVNSNWLYTLRPRIGFANGNMLTYLTAGLAITNLRFSESIYVFPSGPSLTGSVSTTEVGWVAGGGVEYALSYNWFIKAEYLYASFSNQNAPQTGAGAPGFPGTTGTATANLNANIIRGGFDYRF